MSKVKMKYKTTTMRNPATKEVYTDRRGVHIVDVRIYNLDELVKFALDNNYIEGAKYELAKGIVKGAIEAERALIQAGNAVSVDGWVKYEPRLRGSVDAEKRTLTKDNALVVGISALKELKFQLDTFSWQCVDPDLDPGPEPTPADPTVTAINGGGTFYAGSNTVHGTNMKFADAHPASHIVLKDGEGQAVTGVTFADEGTASETEFGVIVADNEGSLADGADYTWEFAMVDAENNPVTVTHTARWVSE